MNRALFIGCLALMLAGITLPVSGMPLFNYKAASNWADETVKTDIPKADRIYIFGPEKVTETYLLDNKPTQHDVEVRRVVQWSASCTLESALEMIPLKKTKKFWVRIYRETTEDWKPVFSVTVVDFKKLQVFPMQARDVVLIECVTPDDGKPHVVI